jgi:hypothetical protein
MIRAAIIAVLLAVASPVAAAQLWATPPAKYVHPFKGRVLVLKNLTPFALGAFWPVYGYSFVWPGNPPTCIMQVWKPYWSTSLYRHERAHCNGWPAWHPTS